MSDGKGYLLPSIINPDDSHYVCVEVPDDINHRIAFLGALSSLVKWYNWERDDLKQGAEAANVWKPIYLDVAFQLDQRFPACDQIPDEGCKAYAPDSGFVSFLPMNPYTQPDLVPDGGYLFPPFIQGDNLFPNWLPDIVENALVQLNDWLASYQPTDIIVPPSSFPLLANWDDLLNGGFQLPVVTFKVLGEGIAEIHLLNVPFGGSVLISVDVEPNVSSVISGVINDNIHLLELERDLSQIPPELTEVNIIELEISGDGEHTVYITFLPTFDDAVVPVRFGGGIRKIVLCDVEPLIELEDEEMTGCCSPEQLARLFMLQAQGLLAGDLGSLDFDADGNAILIGDESSGSDVIVIPETTDEQKVLGSAYGVPQGIQQFFNELRDFKLSPFAIFEVSEILKDLYDLDPAVSLFGNDAGWLVDWYDELDTRTNPDLNDTEIAGYVYCNAPIRSALRRYLYFGSPTADEYYFIDKMLEIVTDAQLEIWHQNGANQPRTNFFNMPCYRQPAVTLLCDAISPVTSDGSFNVFPTQRLLRVTLSGSIADDTSDAIVDGLYKVNASGAVSNNGFTAGSFRLTVNTAASLLPLPDDRPSYSTTHNYVYTVIVPANWDGQVFFAMQSAVAGFPNGTGQIAVTVEDLGEWISG